MDRAEAYAILAGVLERWRRLPFGELIEFLEAPPSVESMPLRSESIGVEVRVRWAEVPRGAVRIEAIANGPSCWRLERLEEAVTVRPPNPLDPSAGAGRQIGGGGCKRVGLEGQA